MSTLVISRDELKGRTWRSYSNKTESKPLLGHLTFPSLREGWPACQHSGGFSPAKAKVFNATEAEFVLLCETRTASKTSALPFLAHVSLADREISHEAVYLDKHGVCHLKVS